MNPSGIEMANSPSTLKFFEFRRKRSLKVSIKGREVNDRLSLRIILIVESIFQFIGGDVCSINTAITKHKLLTCKKLLPFENLKILKKIF